ncbi:MAG: sulfate adenylyltransferase, partial [Pseudomonadota bacterium]
MALIQPHGSRELMTLLLQGGQRDEEIKKAKTLPSLKMTSRETSDLIMMGIGAFTPLTGFMNQADWKGVCASYKTANGLFWPIPIT